MKKLTFILTFILLAGSVFGQEKTNKKEIEEVAITFMDCLAKKDSARFYALFHEDPVTWVGVFKEKTHQALLKRSSNVPTHFMSNYKQFFRSLSIFTSCEEKFYNMEIIEDGSVASVTFDYSF
jgi:hypothetical protein